jgi:hypothetical protein
MNMHPEHALIDPSLSLLHHNFAMGASQGGSLGLP